MKSSRFTRAAVAALALAAAAAASRAAVESFTSGATFFKRVITNTSGLTTAAATFTDVPSTLSTIFVPLQTTVLVSVDYSAEAACYGGGAGNPNWCELMVLIGEVEGSPQASTTSLGNTCAFACTDNGAASSASWRGQALIRHRCVRSTSNAAPAVPVSLQWKVVPFGAVAKTFRLDDSAMVIRTTRDRIVQPVAAPANIGPVTNGGGQSPQ